MANRTDLVSETIGNFNIDNDLVYRVRPNDFGYLSKDDTISAADPTGLSVGGIRIFPENETHEGILLNERGEPDYEAQNYAVKITQLSEDPTKDSKAFVHVPWLNTKYRADGFLIQLCSTGNDYNQAEGKGGIYEFRLIPENIPINVLSNLNTEATLLGQNVSVSSLNQLSIRLAIPLRNEISDLREEYKGALEDYYRKIETSSSGEINDLCIKIHDEISSDFYTKTQINTITSDICATVDSKFALSADVYGKKDVYNKSEITALANTLTENINTRALSIDVYGKKDVYNKNETYTQAEVNSNLELKQDNLNIFSSISVYDDTRPAEMQNKDVATVAAIRSFVNSSLATETADFRGMYNNLREVPRESSGYPEDPSGNRTPNKNDYIVADVTSDKSGAWNTKVANLSVGTWKFRYIGDWSVKLISGWEPEYIMNKDTFTQAQKDAINSGITTTKVNDIISITDIKTTIENDYPNLTRKFGNLASLDNIDNNITGSGVEGKFAIFTDKNIITSSTISPKYEEWTFEFLDPINKVTKKVMLAE